MRRLLLASLFIVGAMGTGIGQSGGIYLLTGTTVGSGFTRMSGGVFTASVTTGQPAATVLATGGTFSVISEPPIFPVPQAPTVVAICGTILGEGRGLNKANVTATDQIGTPWSAVSSPHGEFCLAGLPTGRVYYIIAVAKHYTFQPVVISLSDRVDGLDIIGNRE